MLEKLHPRLKQMMVDKGWKDFTDIQKASFEVIYNGQNCIIEAPTSGGKTEAVLFPLLSKIAVEKKSGVRVLYIAPLKALLNDIELRADAYTKKCNLNAFKWHGDVSQGEKMNQMIFPAEVLLTTPESLEAILLRKANWKDVFNNLQAIVIDEAHSFALSERGSHLVCLLERLENEIDSAPQRIGVTATIGNPDELLKWLMGSKALQGQKIAVRSSRKKDKDFKVHYFETDNEEITEFRLNHTLYDLLLNKKSIVFRNSRSHTEDTAKFINERNHILNVSVPLKVRTHHSSVSKYYREAAEQLIKMKSESSLNAIISTSTLELGIDIGELDQVIQIGGLSSSSSFLQRVGRTGRRENRPQYFRGLCQEDNDLLLLAACINLGLDSISENILFPHKAYHILAHQVICLILQKNGTTADQIWKILSRAYCFSGISENKFKELIQFMTKEEFLRLVDNEILVTANRTEDLFLRANWSRLFAIFETGPMYNVVDGKKVIGTLDCSFVRMQNQTPFLFVLGGIEWKAIKVNHETQQVSVQKNLTGIIPKWKVFSNNDIPFEIAQETGKILMSNKQFAFLDQPATIVINKMRETYENLEWQENVWVLDMEDTNKVLIYTFAGDKINRTIAALFDYLKEYKTTFDFMRVEIGPHSATQSSILHAILSFLERCKVEFSERSIEDMIKDDIKNVKFSKFSVCLPENLSKEALIDKGLDIGGFIKGIKKASFQLQ